MPMETNEPPSRERNVIVEKSFQLALDIVEFAEKLESERKFVVARQILRAGTSIGANVREAQSAESSRDFLHKMKIAAKEAEETEYWLLICKHSKSYPESDSLLLSIKEVIKILNSIIYSINKKIKGQ
jgi:four helix bundle protein